MERSHSLTMEPRRVQHEFGKFRLSHGWIQCRSRNYPKRSYYHNVHSGCNTWVRPLSRYVNIPSICLSRQDMYNENNVTTNSLELVSLSDDENQPEIRRKSHILITELNHDASGESCMLQVGLTVDTDDSNESDESTFQWEPAKCFNKNEQIINAEDSDDSDLSKAVRLPLHDMKSFRKKRITVSPVLTSFSATSRRRRVVSRPKRTDRNRVKREQTTAVVPKDRGPRKIICDMYGVKTINYFYEPEDMPVDQTCTKLGVRCSRLSDSDSNDIDEPPSSGNDLLE